tara:strand:+ start:150522 stop:151523 length:1002 start_codon:yes stop_codon:yes gene_type:complete
LRDFTSLIEKPLISALKSKLGVFQMLSIKNIASTILVAGVCLSSTTLMADNLNNKDFRVCKPYRLEVRSLSDSINNFEAEVLAPLERELGERSSRVNHRASDERKLEIVVRDIENRISTAEGRLSSNPGAIEANKRRMVEARQEISSLEREIVKLEKDLEDAGFIKRPIIKKKIKNRKKDIKKEEQRIVSLQNDNVRLANEINTLPGQIEANRERLVTAEANLASLRNRVPTLAQLRDEERAVRQRLDSQEDIESNLRRDLLRADRELNLCRRIADDARSYNLLKSMAKRLKAADCNVELVRSRLPYDVTKLELRALEEANRMVCVVETPVAQ